jgi:WD40 repeat protein
LKGHRESIIHVSFLPDGKRALSASSDGRINIYDALTGELQRSIQAHEGFLGAFSRGGAAGFAISPGGKWALTQGADAEDGPCVLKLWDLEREKFVRSLGLGERVPYVAISPDGKFAIFADANFQRLTEDGEIRLRELTTGALVHAFAEKEGWWELPVGFSTDGKYAFLWKKKTPVYAPSHLVLWDLAGQKPAREFAIPIAGPPHSFFPPFFQQPEALVVPIYQPLPPHEPALFQLEYWDLRTGERQKAVSLDIGRAFMAKGTVGVRALGFSADGKKAAICATAHDTRIQVWDLERVAMEATWVESLGSQGPHAGAQTGEQEGPEARGREWLLVSVAGSAILVVLVASVAYWMWPRRRTGRVS